MRHTITQKPLISVILPVYNASRYLIEALESLRYQTYPHFEVIAIDDASTDNSYRILEDYAKLDSRFKVFKNKTNLKIARTLNLGLKKAKSNFIARMDADDISLPNRLQKQIKYLLAHPGVVIVGGQCLTIDENSHLTGKKLFPTRHIGIHEAMYTRNPLQHPAVLINRGLLPKNFRWYNPELTPAEDLDLYFRLGKFGLYANLGSVVLMYRQHASSETFRDPKNTFRVTQLVRHLAVQKHGYKPSLKYKLVSLAQTIAVDVLPSSLIFPVYRLLRSTKIKTTLDSLRLQEA